MSYIKKKEKKKKKKRKFVFPLFLHILLSKYCACLDKFCNDRYWIVRGLYCEEIDNKGISMIHDHLQALFLTCSRVLDEWIHMIRKNSIPPSFARPRWTFIASFSLRKKKKKYKVFHSLTHRGENKDVTRGGKKINVSFISLQTENENLKRHEQQRLSGHASLTAVHGFFQRIFSCTNGTIGRDDEENFSSK